jgi:hypothetical protein
MRTERTAKALPSKKEDLQRKNTYPKEDKGAKVKERKKEREREKEGEGKNPAKWIGCTSFPQRNK